MSEEEDSEVTALPTQTSFALLARMLRHLSPDSTDSSQLRSRSNPALDFTPVSIHPQIADVSPHMSIYQGGVAPNDATMASSYPSRGLSAANFTPDFYGSPPLRRAG